MAFRRRSFRRSFRSFRRPFRRGAGLRTPRENGAGRYERGELISLQTFGVESDPTSFTLVTSLAQISGHTLAVSDATTLSNQVFFENSLRSLDVGGLVFDCGVQQVQDDNDFSEVRDAYCIAGMALVVDRLDNAGVPDAITVPWGQANVPQAAAGQLNSTEEDLDWPMRILWRRQTYVQFGVAFITTGNVVQTVGTNQQSWHANLRPKVKLTDQFGLFLHQWVRVPETYPAELTQDLRFWFSGSIYYRWRL